MLEHPVSFRRLLHPMTQEEFLSRAWQQAAIHIPGHAAKLQDIHTWNGLSSLLEMITNWSCETLKMTLEADELPATQFSLPGCTGDRHGGQVPDPNRIRQWLAQGATLLLESADCLSAGVTALARSLESVLGAPLSCELYCCTSEHPGRSSRFDTVDRFALQIDGRKLWNIYEGRVLNPADSSNFCYARFSPKRHEKARGRCILEVEMQPGDVLYVPKGQYYDVMGSREESQHLSFDLRAATGLDFMEILLKSLSDDSLFRQSMPHFDEAELHAAHMGALADRIHQHIAQPVMSEQMRAHQRECALRRRTDSLASSQRPAQATTTYRVRSTGVTLDLRADGWALATPETSQTLTDAEAEVLRWILDRDVFEAGELHEAFVHLADVATVETLEKTDKARVTEQIP